MPEVAEVAHVCALLKRNVLGFKIASVVLNNDPLLFPALKAAENPEKEIESFRGKLVNSTIHSIGRHGKYFWLRLNLFNSKETGVLLMHLGMTGMIKIRNIESHLTFMENGGDKKILDELKKDSKGETSKYFKKEIENVVTVGEYFRGEDEEEEKKPKQEDNEWPPRFSKLEMVLENGDSKYDLSFVDPRRLGRIRLLEGPGVQTDDDLLLTSPLDALGPDYSKPLVPPKVKLEFGDPDPHTHGRPRPTVEEFSKLVLSKKKPIKSLLLDQAFFSGIGNWVSDEIVYHARIHPGEVISSKIPPDLEEVHPTIQKLYDSIIYICQESVRVEGDVKKFPDDWLMLHRWGKARKKGPKQTTKDGYVVDHETIGGRTSCFVPELQKPLESEVSKATKPLKKEKVVKKKPTTTVTKENAYAEPARPVIADNSYDEPVGTKRQSTRTARAKPKQSSTRTTAARPKPQKVKKAAPPKPEKVKREKKAAPTKRSLPVKQEKGAKRSKTVKLEK
ncbi:Formamidopyrimidine-DNA glycosylase N-terminal domain-containing protein [Scheffersomyces xylosifermentans]|uniref:Formamidopyrimidine-DNA glycosylase N-terminal domain-containing protein n=1 Tax=Scheffersomyces xylosifermentans TaxID=1304137 RepID=UPI00315D6EC0